MNNGDWEASMIFNVEDGHWYDVTELNGNKIIPLKIQVSWQMVKNLKMNCLNGKRLKRSILYRNDVLIKDRGDGNE